MASPNGPQPTDPVIVLRQRERTIDNVKRLFAVIFALSFTTMGRNAYETVKPFLVGTVPPAPFHVWIIYLEMVLVFVVTASVFYHQGAKFLDQRYASGSGDEANPAGFASDFFVLFATMIPFVLMANSLDPTVTAKVGFTSFFYSYVLLITQGLVLLLWAEFRHSRFFRSRFLRSESISAAELDRDSALRTYWLIMNSLAYLLIALLFKLNISHSVICPIRVTAEVPWFLIAFGIVTIARDWLDFAWAWPFLYPVSNATYRWPITRIRERSWRIGNVDGYVVLGVVLMLAGFFIAFSNGWWNYAYWTHACAP